MPGAGRYPPGHGEVERPGVRSRKYGPQTRQQHRIEPPLLYERLHIMDFEQWVLVQREYGVEPSQEFLTENSTSLLNSNCLFRKVLLRREKTPVTAP